MFEEEYEQQLNEFLTLEDTPYNRYLKGIKTTYVYLLVKLKQPVVR